MAMRFGAEERSQTLRRRRNRAMSTAMLTYSLGRAISNGGFARRNYVSGVFVLSHGRHQKRTLGKYMFYGFP
jgi:hypothetical protein